MGAVPSRRLNTWKSGLNPNRREGTAPTIWLNLMAVKLELGNQRNLLTEKFFAYLKQGKNKLEALRLARADLRHEGYAHPYFWAPFILVGEL